MCWSVKKSCANGLRPWPIRRAAFSCSTTLDVFCSGDEATCSILKDGRILYRDSHHLGHFGSLEFGKVFADWFAATVK